MHMGLSFSNPLMDRYHFLIRMGMCLCRPWTSAGDVASIACGILLSPRFTNSAHSLHIQHPQKQIIAAFAAFLGGADDMTGVVQSHKWLRRPRASRGMIRVNPAAQLLGDSQVSLASVTATKNCC